LSRLPAAVRTGGDLGGAKAVRAAGGIRGAHALALMQGGECGGNLPQPGQRCWQAGAGGAARPDGGGSR
jgi:hypothetical protein